MLMSASWEEIPSFQTRSNLSVTNPHNKMNLSFKHIILCLFLLNPDYIVNICFSRCAAVSKRRNNVYSFTNIQQSVWLMNTYSIIPLVGKYLITQLLCNLIKNFEYSSFQLSIDEYQKNTLIPSARTQIFLGSGSSALALLSSPETRQMCRPLLRPAASESEIYRTYQVPPQCWDML